MNAAEHKAESEALIKNADEQSDIVTDLINRSAPLDMINVAVGIMQATVAKAQVHATLANVPDPAPMPWTP